MSAELIEDGIKVTLDCIGEGWNGDYDIEDPDDTYLMRFDVYIKNPESFNYPYTDWLPVEDASYCTAFPENTLQELQDKAVRFIMNQIKNPLLNGYSIKKLCEKLSWIDPTWVISSPDKDALDWFYSK